KVPYLKQLMMESNGKRVGEDGAPQPLQGAPGICGVPGTDCQHSVFQWMHQSPAEAPAEFLLPVAPHGARAEHQEALMANCLAQASALMLGRDRAATAALGGDPALVPHREFPGNRPSTLILFDGLTPRRLGALIALYEHRTAAQAAMLGFNAFDQWGVEYGKSLAGRIAPLLQTGGEAPDPATAASLATIRAMRAGPGGSDA
ncbi:MAG: glucose-6-phosphate isomerase, partial [Pseudomonadota bacterium]